MSILRLLGGLLCSAVTLTAAGCSELDLGGGGASPDGAVVSPHSERGGIGLGTTSQGLVSPSQTINARRSLAVTELGILSQFPLPAVMDQLAAQNGNPALTGAQLFRQLWETQNPAASGGTADLQPSAHCADNGTTLNGFPNVCRTSEGAQAGSPISIVSYSPIGLYNRFDLAPNTGANCGEYRLVYGKTMGSGRAFIIFEAILPNPRPELGLEGCRQVQAFWRDLSNTSDVNARATALRGFYFNGLPGYQPVIHMDNFGFNSAGAGQVRVNMFIGSPWELKEFKLLRQCPLGVCVLKAVPVTVKANPYGDLFNPASTEPLAADFRTHFLTQVQPLAFNDVNRFNYEVPDQFNAAHSDSMSGGVEDDYLANFAGPSTFRDDIQTQLDNLSSSVTPDEIVARAQSLSCGGCHQRSFAAALGGGLQGPISAGFVHSTEFQESGPDGTRFSISISLPNTVLPFRKSVVEEYLSAVHPVTTITRFNMVASAVDAKNVYWVENRPGGSVMQASLNSGSERVLGFNRASPTSVTTDGTHVYWTQGGNSIVRKPVGSGSATTRLSGRSGMTGKITVDANNVYWQENNDILKSPKNTLSISTLLTRPSITSISSDGTNLYLAEDLFPGNVLRMPVGGGTPTAAFSGTLFLTSVAVGPTHFAWTMNANPGPVMAKVKD